MELADAVLLFVVLGGRDLVVDYLDELGDVAQVLVL